MRLPISLLKDLFLALFGVLCIFSTAEAQNNLYRVSNASRSDGLGHVIRFHLESKVDSFEVIQPAPDFIQVVLYDRELDTAAIRLPDFSENQNINNMRLVQLQQGVGVDIILSNDEYFKSSSYLDKNGAHVLLALTQTEKTEVERFSQQFIAKTWDVDFDVIGNFPVSNASQAITTSNREAIKDRLRFDKVVIDAGHGDWEPGSIGYRGVKEKEITLDIALKVGKLIEERIPGVEVVYTRTDDTYLGLDERGHYANLEGGDLFLSIHCNSFPQNRSVRGTEVYFLGLHKSDDAHMVMQRENSVFRNDTRSELSEQDLIVYELAHSGNLAISEKIATMIDWEFKNKARRKSRGVKQAGFQVLYEASMPALLVETGFITNPDEQKYLSSDYGQDIIASAIYRAIKRYKLEVDPSADNTQALNTRD
ncbi:N-acetylmuramoyl-L-alanine amidase [Balneola sp. MJW-20]|uniref:N-acetylmuramoyl-L-alanine amidase family protein n=1 Tax=Gracilimonas aurantiaca TaxID=3234185 RepID=UPI0034666037